MSSEHEEECEKMVRITPTVYARMKAAAKRDSRSIAKEVDFACKVFLQKNHPDLIPLDDRETPKPPKESGKD